MAAQGIQPFIHVEDANGMPYVGATLAVYDATTTNYRAIYSDQALSVPLTNPLSGVNASDAAGNFPRFYLAPGTYKLRAETSAEVLIWEVDNIDTGLSAGIGALPIASGGTGATTAAAALANLGGASTSEVAALSAQIATLSNSLNSLAAFPQGRLTLTSGTPVLATGVTSASTVYYTPYIGQLCPVWDGAQFNLKIFPELSLTLSASHVLNSIYDCYVIDDATDGIVLVTSPAWSNIAAGTGSRSGTCDLARLQGLWVNSAQLTMRNGGTTYTVGASKGTYVGSIYIDGVAGQVTCHTAYGQSRKWGVWNTYNRVPIVVEAGDATASWIYSVNTRRASNNNAANALTIFSGLPEEAAIAQFKQTLQISASATGGQSGISIGLNSATVASGYLGSMRIDIGSGSLTGIQSVVADYAQQPFIGINTLNCQEITPSVAAATNTYLGGSTQMLLRSTWRG